MPKRFTVTFSAELAKILEYEASKNEISVSALIRMLVIRAIDSEENNLLIVSE